MAGRLEFDALLDEWPAGAEGEALWSLVRSGDVIATRLPRGFVGIRIVPSHTQASIVAGRLRIRQVFPPRGTGVPVLFEAA